MSGDTHARLAVVGAGFAGASLIRNLPYALRGETLLIDRAAEYAFAPLIHEVAAGRVHPDSVVSPIAPLCRGRCDFLQAEVGRINLERRKIATSSGEISYEYLVLAPGSAATPPPDTFVPHLRPFGGLEAALELRETLADAWRSSLDRRRNAPPEPLTVAIVGGGTTGVELAAEISALFRYLKRRTPRRLSARPAVMLLEATDRLMGWLDPYFHRVAAEELKRLGAEVRLESPVQEVRDGCVRAGKAWLPAQIQVWTAGVTVRGLTEALPGERDPSGRLKVDAHLGLPGYPEVYVLGDASVYTDPRLGPLPPTASVAVQQGPFAARDLGRRLRNIVRPPFRFNDRGYVVSLGPGNAVGNPLGAKIRGAAAQGLYRSVLLYYMKSRRSRLFTASDWAMDRALGRVGF